MTNEVKALYYHFLGRTQKLSVKARAVVYQIAGPYSVELMTRTHTFEECVVNKLNEEAGNE